MTLLIPVDRYRRRLRSRKPVMLALPCTACKCERYQLRMRAIFHSKHTKLKYTKIYSKGVLASHTKISTDENFPLYGMQQHAWQLHCINILCNYFTDQNKCSPTQPSHLLDDVLICNDFGSERAGGPTALNMEGEVYTYNFSSFCNKQFQQLLR